MIQQNLQKILFLSISVLVLHGCTMERVPASVQKTSVSIQIDAAACSLHAFPASTTSLLPNIRLIDCEVKSDIDPELVEFEFEHIGGEIFGAQTGKRIEEVTLITNEFGLIYYLNYVPIHGIQQTLGRWCCWDEDSEVPSNHDLLPNELDAIHVKSDGGMVYRASWKYNQEPKGLAFILCGLGGMQHSSKTLGAELLKDGWAVVYMLTVLNVPDYSLEVTLEGEYPASAAINLFDKKYCQVITATKAIRERMEEQLPSLQHLPLALIGISAGALNTPAVYHELQDDVDAVVLVAGGANMFTIVQDGVFTNWHFVDEQKKRFSNDELKMIEAEYLRIPSRDPYFLAPELPRDRTLIIHAKWDKIVPAKNGDLLYNRAGKPERWIYPSGHLGLFATFSSHAPEIVTWIDSKIDYPSGK
jgi:hypothetical protein